MTNLSADSLSADSLARHVFHAVRVPLHHVARKLCRTSAERAEFSDECLSGIELLSLPSEF